VAELEARFKPQLEELGRQIGYQPWRASLYLERAKVYVGMYRSLMLHRPEGRHFVEKALTDFSAAINLQASAEAYLGRAWCRQQIIWTVKAPRRDRPKETVDFFFSDPLFPQTLSDLRDAARLGTTDEEHREAFSGLSRLHSWRARSLAAPEAAAEMRARGTTYSVWDDFDRSLGYAREAVGHTPEKVLEWPTFREEAIGAIYAEIGSAAYGLGEYGRALSAFQSGEKHLTEHYQDFCGYHAVWGDTYAKTGQLREAIATFTRALARSEWNCRYLLERRGDAHLAYGSLNDALADYTALLAGTEKFPGCMSVPFCLGRLPMKRAKVYLRLGQPEKAVAEIDFAVEKAFIGHCREVLSLRAEAHRRLGNLPLALADEQRAAKLEPSRACVQYYIEGFDD